MTLDAIQSSFAALIAADGTLSPLGTAIQVDPFQDPEAAKSAIAGQLRATGVCIEIGFPSIDGAETNLGGVTHADATCDVYVAEQPLVTHSPSRIALVMRVIKTLTARPSGTQKPARLRSWIPQKTESGYILHEFSFFVPLNLH